MIKQKKYCTASKSNSISKGFALLLLMSLAVFQTQAQTILAPRLTCIVNDFVGDNVSISWENVNNPCGPFVSYKLYGSNTKAGPYSLITTIASQAQTNFVHTNALSPNSTWFYYMEADFNCPGFTPAQSDTIQNESNPRVPQIVSVDVDSTNHVTFNWLPSESPQTKFYIVYAYLPNGGVVPIDTVYGRFNTSYYDLIEDPTQISLGYTISASDSCPGNQPSAYNTNVHYSTLLTASVSRCAREIKLKWSKYVNLAGGVVQYKVFVNKNLTGYVEVGTTDSNTTSFPYTDFSDNDSICITVAAVSGADTTFMAKSNFVCMRPSIVQPPDFVHITRVSVTPDNIVEVNWITDTKAELLTHEVLASNDCRSYESMFFQKVIPPNVLQYTLLDSLEKPQDNWTCYRIVAFDSCQGTDTSTHAKTINLYAELTDYYEIKVDWNDYELDGATISRYNLYRNYGAGWQKIRTFLPGTNDFRDSLYQFLSETGEFCYYIEAEYTLNLPDVPYTANLTSTSNVVCLYHRPIIYIPNAFSPNGVNQIFKPTIYFGDPANYSLSIFNRYGGRIFESTSPSIGWDGTDAGKPVQQGGYAYLIKFIAADGTNVERKGVVILIRN
ncbi:MAG: gliding motility-associated C-terminal domain-containing protein [Chitinophagales bacterium]|nr:gliding motility-associated C-terminal domain-containing protein [Chitinophagales bacterium]